MNKNKQAREEIVMKPALNSLLVTMVSVNPAYAAMSLGELFCWLGWLFTGLAALIISCQLVPTIILFAAMLNGVPTAAVNTPRGEGQSM